MYNFGNLPVVSSTGLLSSNFEDIFSDFFVVPPNIKCSNFLNRFTALRTDSHESCLNRNTSCLGHWLNRAGENKTSVEAVEARPSEVQVCWIRLGYHHLLKANICGLLVW